MGTTLRSMFLKLNINDVVKSALMLILTTIISSLGTIFSAGAFPTGAEFAANLKIAVIAGLAYLCKNLLTNSEGQFMKGEPK